MMSDGLESAIQLFGREIITTVRRSAAPPLGRRGIASSLMRLTMRYPQFKTALFRLLDVLPALHETGGTAQHIAEYLHSPAAALNPLLGWWLGGGRGTVRGSVNAIATRLITREMARLFIAGESVEQALPALQRMRQSGFAFTVDLLGEFCVSEEESLATFQRYSDVISGLKVLQSDSKPLISNHRGDGSPICVSVKLTALSHRCDALDGVGLQIMHKRLAELAVQVQALQGILYVDAEDSASNPLIYEAFKQVFSEPRFHSNILPGIVIQAVLRHSAERVADIIQFAKNRGAPVAVRLVKGAYLEAERALSLQNGWVPPVWSTKAETDANFEMLSRTLLMNTPHIIPAFGSHNIRSLAHAVCVAEELGVPVTNYELQMLYGMAEPIAKAFAQHGYLVRLYVPIGELLPGMGYLVRRLLENTSNESFLRHTFIDGQDVEELLVAPTVYTRVN